MNSTTYRSPNRPRLTTALVLIAGGVVGLLAACSSDGPNARPSDGKPPVINTGGGGSGNSDNDAGESSVAGSRANAGRSNGGSGGKGAPVAEGGASGEGGEAGEAGAGPGPVVACPATDDLGFLNQPSSSQKEPFENTKRLGAAAALPPL